MSRITVFISFFLFFPVLIFADGGLRIHFIDIGEGDAILIQHRNNNILIDAGNLLSGYKLAGYLEKNAVNKIDHLIVTHPHPDHIGGLFFILPKFQTGMVYDNGRPLDKNDDMQRWYGMLARARRNYSVLKKGDRLKFGSVVLDILWPQASGGSSCNDDSVVVKLKYGKFKCLFTGDLTAEAEGKILALGIDVKADILKVGHHGYRDATSPLFLKKVSPDAAVISAGPHNIIGAPSREVLDLLNRARIKIYRTDQDENIIVDASDSGVFSIKD